MATKIVLGWREWVALPALGIAAVRAKVDSGARSSALHVDAQWRFAEGGAPWVGFRLQSGRVQWPPSRRPRRCSMNARSPTPAATAPAACSCARSLRLAGIEREIEMNLSDRRGMLFPMLLGRTAMARRVHGRSGTLLPSRPLRHSLTSAHSVTHVPMKLAILSRNSKLYSTRRLVEAAREQRPQRARARPAALLHAHRQRRLRDALQGPADRRLPRGDPARGRLGDPLRHRGAAPVRADGQLHAEPVRRDPQGARQAALPPVAGGRRASACRPRCSATTRTTPTTCCRCSARRRT